MRVLYFGCAKETGHYLHSSEWTTLSSREAESVFPPGCGEWTMLDGGFAPRVFGADKRLIFQKDYRDGYSDHHGYSLAHYRSEELPNGVAALHHLEGRTVLAWWDNSVDKRGASNSAFVFDQVVDFDAAVSAAKAAFPSVFARMKFQVVLLAAPDGGHRG